jgi:nitroreductase
MEFQRLIAKRRMVRNFSDQPVDRAVLERIAAAAQRAPSAGFSQGQRLVVVTDRLRQRKVAELAYGEDYVEAGFNPWILRGAAQFIPCVSEEVYHRRYQEADKVLDDGTEIDWPVPYWWIDVGMTALLILLAAVDEGLAAGYAGTADWQPIKAELGIPEEFMPIGIIPVGHPAPDKPSPSLKRGWVPSESFTRWEHW